MLEYSMRRDERDSLYNLPNVLTLYSKKEILKMEPDNSEKYWSCVDGREYIAYVKDEKLFAKQYPGKKHYYLISDLEPKDGLDDWV